MACQINLLYQYLWEKTAAILSAAPRSPLSLSISNTFELMIFWMMELTCFQPAFSAEDGRATAYPPHWKYIQIRVCCCHGPGPLDEPVTLEVYFPSVADVADFDRSWSWRRRARHCSCKCEATGGGTQGSGSPCDAQKKGLLLSVVVHLRNIVGQQYDIFFQNLHKSMNAGLEGFRHAKSGDQVDVEGSLPCCLVQGPHQLITHRHLQINASLRWWYEEKEKLLRFKGLASYC